MQKKRGEVKGEPHFLGPQCKHCISKACNIVIAAIGLTKDILYRKHALPFAACSGITTQILQDLKVPVPASQRLERGWRARVQRGYCQIYRTIRKTVIDCLMKSS